MDKATMLAGGVAVSNFGSNFHFGNLCLRCKYAIIGEGRSNVLKLISNKHTVKKKEYMAAHQKEQMVFSTL